MVSETAEYSLSRSGADDADGTKTSARSRTSCAEQRAGVPIWRQNPALFAKSCAKNGVPLLTEDRQPQRPPLLAQGILIPWLRGVPPPPHSNQSLQAHQEKAAGRAWSTSRVLRCRIPGGGDRFWTVFWTGFGSFRDQSFPQLVAGAGITALKTSIRMRKMENGAKFDGLWNQVLRNRPSNQT